MTYLIVAICLILLAFAIWFLRWDHKERNKKKWRVKTERMEKPVLKDVPQVKTVLEDEAWQRAIEEQKRKEEDD